jgi:hypothetical protein
MLSTPDDPRPVVAIDWSFHQIHATFDGELVERFTSVDALLQDPRLCVPHKIAAEATFESWDPERRRSILVALRSSGHELYVYRPLNTARARSSLGLTKSDELDAKVIWMHATHPKFHLYTPKDVNPEWATRFAAAQKEYALLRLTGEKSEMASKAAEVLGPLSSRSECSRAVLASAQGYSETILAVLWFCASKDLTRNEMEKLVGLSAAGYPSLLRSELHTHSARHARKRLLQLPNVHSSRSLSTSDLVAAEPPDDSVKDWRVYRREIRRAYSELRSYLHASVEP